MIPQTSAQTVGVNATEKAYLPFQNWDRQSSGGSVTAWLKEGAARQTVKFSFRVNNGGTAFEIAAGRSVSKDNPLTFHNDWSTHWANEVEFGFEQ